MLSVINFGTECMFLAVKGFIGCILILIVLYIGIKILNPYPRSSRRVRYRDSVFKKINTLSDNSRAVEAFKKLWESPDALMEVEAAENIAPEIIRLNLQMMEELFLKGLDMEAIERILHIKRRKDA